MSELSSKVLTLQALSESSVPELEGVSLCYGLFNVIHPGHLRYFQTARQHGDCLVVAVEGANALYGLERTESFSEVDRARAVAALEIVDRVVILDAGRLEDLVSLIKPRSMVLGREFESERLAEVEQAVARVRKFGGQVFYAAGETHYATSDLFSGSQYELERDRWWSFRSALSSRHIDLNEALARISESPEQRILVLGDTIVDRYVACDPVGMSSEAPVVVVKELEDKEFVGGAAIVAGHVAALGAESVYLSVIGKDTQAKFIENKLAEFGVTSYLFEDPSRPTTNKIRYMVEGQKLFRVSRLKEHSLQGDLEELVLQKLVELAPSLQGILVCDFVYGVITPRILEVLETISRKYKIPLFGDLQCSSQIGDISKFQNFQLLCPTEREARIALNNQDDSVETVANMLMDETRSSKLLVKLGADGFIAYDRDAETGFMHRQHFPALIANPMDVAGAGDALLAAVSVGLTHGLTLMEASALGCCVAGLAVQTVGNIPVRQEEVKRFVDQREIKGKIETDAV